MSKNKKTKKMRIHGFGEEIFVKPGDAWPVKYHYCITDQCFTLFQALLCQDHHCAVYPFPEQRKLLCIRKYGLGEHNDDDECTVEFATYDPTNYERNRVEGLADVQMSEQEVMDFLRELGVPWDKPVWYAMDAWGYGETQRKQNFRQYVLAAVRGSQGITPLPP